MKKTILSVVLFLSLIAGLVSCDSSVEKSYGEETKPNIRSQVDFEVQRLDSAISEFEPVLRIDHSRLAEAEGVYTPPSMVSLFSNPKVNSELIRLNPLTGLDLPYKVLCYAEPDTLNARLAYTSAEFLSKRHGLSDEGLRSFENDMGGVLAKLSDLSVSETDLARVDLNYGIITLQSDFDFSTTVQKLKGVVQAQSDTQWFGEIDFQLEAKGQNIEIGPTTLLLFGGPAPGGKAMVDSPKLGLDAFCQKLLVFENEKSEVLVAFNDIPALANLYYNRSTKPQELINERLKMTFEKAISNN